MVEKPVECCPSGCDPAFPARRVAEQALLLLIIAIGLLALLMAAEIISNAVYAPVEKPGWKEIWTWA
jgi:hypothetical protein